MRNFLIILIILAVISAGAYYFFIYKNKDYTGNLGTSGFLAKLNFLKNSGISQKSEELNKTAEDFKAKAGDVISGFSKTFDDTVNKVSSTVASINTEVDSNKLIKVISVLNGNKISGSEVAPVTVSSGTAKEVAVCANVGLNQPTTYLIDDPFYSASASSTYDIDWGDGKSDKMIFTAGTAQVSHIYVSTGEFLTKFKVVNEKSSAEVSRRVCVR